MQKLKTHHILLSLEMIFTAKLPKQEEPSKILIERRGKSWHYPLLILITFLSQILWECYPSIKVAVMTMEYGRMNQKMNWNRRKLQREPRCDLIDSSGNIIHITADIRLKNSM